MHVTDKQSCNNQGQTDHLKTRALPEVSRGPHEMPLVPFS
ncbi:unnamed protein product [Staurois parvus]|uniref:Prolactin receptor n=1 Tax=Staurois parvus TaxID=386267 RepID=A0ABN9HN22_9NEOB|nr:unnamed protein product [Staurois parvus]